MSDLTNPAELFERLDAHKAEVERRAKDDHAIDPYAVLAMHADLRPHLENWDSYNMEQRTAIAEAVNYLTEEYDAFADAGPDGYDDDREIVAELPGKLERLSTD